jgi:hypothetical protein
VGLVDKSVMDGINITATAKKMFTRSIVYTGDAFLLLDDLQLSGELDTELSNQSALGRQSPLSYSEAYKTADAYSLRGNYEVAGNQLTLNVSLVYKNKKIGAAFVQTGTVDKKNLIVKKIVADIVASLEKE